MKKIQIVLFAALMLISSAVNAQEQVLKKIDIYIDGRKQLLEPTPIIFNDVTLIPLRGVFENLGTQVKWDSKDLKIIAVKESTTLTLKINSETAFINGLPVHLDQKPILLNGRTMVPLRFVSEVLGANVTWNGEKGSIHISTTSVMGAEEGKNIISLSYEDALKKALANSIALRNTDADIDRSLEVREKAAGNVTFLPIGNGNGVDDSLARKAVTGLQQADVALQSAKKNRDITQDSVSYNLKRTYNEVLLEIQKKKLAELALKNANWQNHLAKQKYQLGKISDFDRNQAINSYQTAEAELKVNEQSLKDAYQKLNQLVGLSSGVHIELTELPKFEKIEEDLDVHVSRLVSDSITVWIAEQKVNIAKLNLDLYTFNDPTNPDPYKAKEIDVERAQNSVADTKQQLAQIISTIYYNIKKLENQYIILQANLVKAEEAFRLIEAKYEVGLAIEADFLSTKFSVEQVKLQMFDLVAQLDTLKMAYEKPWVYPNNN